MFRSLLILAGSSILFLSSAAATTAPDAKAPATEAKGENVLELPVGARFENGIAAIVEDKIITVGDIRREISPLIEQIRSQSSNAAEFKANIERFEDDIIQNLVDQALIVKDFWADEKHKNGIPSQYIDNDIKETMINQFDNDRSKFLAYLRSIGKTQREYRELVQDNIIVGYMRGQRAKSLYVVSPTRIEKFYTENRDKFYQGDGVHLRLILLKQVADENPALLQQTAEKITQQLKGGADFAALAKEYSQDTRKRNGGDWGWIARTDLREELASAAFALDKGKFSEPIKLGAEIFILYVEDKRLAGIKPLEEVREDIERQLLSQMTRESRERWLERLRRTGYVRYFN